MEPSAKFLVFDWDSDFISDGDWLVLTTPRPDRLLLHADDELRQTFGSTYNFGDLLLLK